MVFKCQEDSFLKEFTSKVVLCEESEIKPTEKSGEAIKGYNVVLEDTILFPEGGGQPCDHGFLNDKKVINVQRKGKDAIHFVVADVPPFHVGESVKEIVDWERRHDHMQQHSGQHLITAIFERDLQFLTLSWSLSPEISYIELDAKANVTQDKIDNVEKTCNELIAASTKVIVHVIGDESGDVPIEVTRATRGLPKDHVGDIRVITIDGVESNMCCGTHVSNLAQLQCVKLLNIEKTKNRQFLHFLVGNRVLKKLQGSFEREIQLNNLLNGGPQSHIDLVKKLQSNQKAGQRTLQKCLKEIAAYEVEKLKTMQPQPKWYSLHRSDGIEPDFINAFLRNAPEISQQTNDGLSLLFLTVGEEGTHKGQLVLFGDPKIVNELGPTICELLEGKGNGKGQRYQAKVNNLKRISECEKRIAEYFNKIENC